MKVRELADNWIEYHLTGDDELVAASEKMERVVANDPERAWHTILTILNKDSSPAIVANLAAGPLEDLLVQHGHAVIDRIENKTNHDHTFTKLILEVWQSEMHEDIWSRVQALQESCA